MFSIQKYSKLVLHGLQWCELQVESLKHRSDFRSGSGSDFFGKLSIFVGVLTVGGRVWALRASNLHEITSDFFSTLRIVHLPVPVKFEGIR